MHILAPRVIGTATVNLKELFRLCVGRTSPSEGTPGYAGGAPECREEKEVWPVALLSGGI